MTAKRPTKTSGSNKSIPWSHIRDFFEGQWIELTDYKWDWNAPTPAFGTIRHHSWDRAELLELIRKDKKIDGSVVLFVGNRRSTFEHSLNAAI